MHQLEWDILETRKLGGIKYGCSVSGATQTLERKRQIYSICRQYNILIMEDDPYYYLQYTPGEPPRGLENLGQSYLSMDTDSRVIRLDSFAKVFCCPRQCGPTLLQYGRGWLKIVFCTSFVSLELIHKREDRWTGLLDCGKPITKYASDFVLEMR